MTHVARLPCLPLTRLASVVGASLVLLAVGCREEDPAAPSSPEPSAAVATAAAALTFTQVSPGSDHTCGVTVDQLAYCWGEAGLGELGTGSSMANQFHPVPVAGGLKFLSVNAGQAYTCGIATDHLAYCWGVNSSGELGDGTTMTRLAPVRVAGTRKFQQLRAGNRHTCGVTLSNVAFCWGFNGNGELGDGTVSRRLKPTRVASTLSFTQAFAGGNHSCGLTTAGKAYCWGANDEGQLGDGTMTRRLSPTAVKGGLTFKQVRPGGAHTCAVTDPDGKAYCWGRNQLGTLGDGTMTRRLTPRLVAAGARRFIAIAPGVFHTCARGTDDRAYCWGANDESQIGDGTNTTRLTPVAVTGGLHFEGGISAGVVGSHTCGVTAAGVAYCWGKNNSGQIGDGTNADRSAPTKVSAPS